MVLPLLLKAEIQLGNKGAAAFGLNSKVEYDSNLNRSANDIDDYIFIAQPNLLYRYDTGLLYIDAFAGLQFRRYDDNTSLNTENIKSGIDIEYPQDAQDTNFDLHFTAGYNEVSTGDSLLQSFIQKEIINLGLTGHYYFTDRYYLSSGILYRSEVAKTDGFADVTTYTLPLDFMYRYNDALSFGLGYRYKRTTVDGTDPTADSDSHSWYLVSEGMLTPTVELEGRLGLQYRDFDESAFDSQTSVFAELVASWMMDERSKLELTAGSDTETTSANQAVESMYLNFAYDHDFDEKLSMRAELGYANNDFERLIDGGTYRSDDKYYGYIEAIYELIEDRLSLNASLYYSDQDSDVKLADYDRTFVIVGVDFVY
ncbi:outer membrane beta-barrel protein [Coraliomargarita parva]|uniref:outer membrane beta-barrel protein n=1 Tax=Coraliomargarita parva TaxID=3014050 RepID=UPI0022B587D5|nr:outer membrane beta-barrel protein [Coraliomargarita parva]